MLGANLHDRKIEFTEFEDPETPRIMIAFEPLQHCVPFYFKTQPVGCKEWQKLLIQNLQTTSFPNYQEFRWHTIQVFEQLIDELNYEPGFYPYLHARDQVLDFLDCYFEDWADYLTNKKAS